MSDLDDAYDKETLAAEYALHLLDDAERLAVEARLGSDRALQELIWAWEARLSPLAETVPALKPPSRIRNRILRTVGAGSAGQRTLPLWAWLAGGAVAAGFFLFVLFGTLLGPKPDMTVAFQAELASDDRAIVMIAGVIPATHEIVVERVAGSAPEGRVYELWLIAQAADGPVSLGLIESGRITRIRVPDDIAPGVRTGTIAVSEEPTGGSPTGAPTGPVIATAQFSDI